VAAAHGNTYAYDANGNQTARTTAGVPYAMTFDAENRLAAVTGGSTSASFVYDAAGSRTVGTVDGVTTVYVGSRRSSCFLFALARRVFDV
jgi:YD repeat-containing protein